MKLKIEITLDDSASEQYRGIVVAGIFREMSDRMTMGNYLSNPGDHDTLTTIHGESVGKVKVTR